MTVIEARRLGRAKNAVLKFLEERLVVPKIYLDAEWGGERIDVLAIDRDGAGDVHAVLLLLLPATSSGAEWVEDFTRSVDPLLDHLEAVAAQYKYVAGVDTEQELSLIGIPHPVNDRSFSLDGIGRIGFLTVTVPLADEAVARLLIKPERFRAKVAKLAEDYVQQHEADWEIRA